MATAEEEACRLTGPTGFLLGLSRLSFLTGCHSDVHQYATTSAVLCKHLETFLTASWCPARTLPNMLASYCNVTKQLQICTIIKFPLHYPMCNLRTQVIPVSMLKWKVGYSHAADYDKRKREHRWNNDNTCKCLSDERKNTVIIFPSFIKVRPDKEQEKLLRSHCTVSQAELHLGPMTAVRGSQETAPDAWKREVDSWVMYRRGFLNTSTHKGGLVFTRMSSKPQRARQGEKLQTRVTVSIKRNGFQ